MSDRKTVIALLITTVVMLTLTGINSYAADASVDISNKHQTIEGFGGGLMFGVFPYNSPKKDEIYDSLFKVARFNVVRIANFYDPQTDTPVTEVPMMVEIQERWPEVKTFMASWSPPAYLKSNDSIAGSINGVKATLKKNAAGGYMYDEYADYWKGSLDYFLGEGVKIDWISIQNEPDWPAEWEGCLLAPNEGEAASYAKAFDAVYDKINSLDIPFIGPDMTGLNGINYTPESYLSSINLVHLHAICHHFYNGDTITKMQQLSQQFPDFPKYQTEYLINEGKEWNGRVQTWFDHIQIIQNALVHEELSMYLLFALAYKQASTHCCFSLDSTAEGDYTLPEGYSTRPIYYAFKHFSRSIGRGWKRVDASAGTGLNISAFLSPQEDSLSIVIINTGDNQSLNLTLPDLPNISPDSLEGAVYQTTKADGSEQSRKYETIETFTGSVPQINLDGSSITTIEIRKMKPTGTVGAGVAMHTGMAEILSVTALGGYGIVITLHIPFDRAYAVSVYDISGKLISARTFGKAGSGPVAHTFSGLRAGGVYTVKLECQGRAVAGKIIMTN